MRSSSPSSSAPAASPQLQAHLDRVRRCIDVTVTHLTTIQALIPTDAELQTASPPRARIDPDELARHRAELERAMNTMAKLARLVLDQTRSSAGLDPQCCDWPSFEETKTGEC